MKFEQIKITKTDGGFCVEVDAEFADRLTPDEALGVVASAIFRNDGKPLFVRTYENWVACYPMMFGPSPTLLLSTSRF